MISISTVVFDGHDMQQGFDVLAALGVDGVEPAFINGYVDFDETAFLPSAAARMNVMLAQSGLQAAALSAHIDLGEPDSAERLLRRADFAARIGAPILVTNATSHNKRAAFVATLDRCLPEFAAMGVVLALENPGHGTDAMIVDGVSGAALVGEFNHPALRLNYDIGNAMTYGACQTSAADDLASALPWCAHLHLKDVAINGADWGFCPIGDGNIGYASLLGWLFRQPDVPDYGIELPLRLLRPGRKDPVRLPDPVNMARVRLAISRSLVFCDLQRQGTTPAKQIR